MSDSMRQPTVSPYVPTWTPGNVRGKDSAAADGGNRVFNFNNMDQDRAAHLVKRVNRGRKMAKGVLRVATPTS